MEKPTIETLENNDRKKGLTEKAKFNRAWFLSRGQNYYPPPKGIFKKRCPLCGEKLKVQLVYFLYYWECKCGYEYGENPPGE